MTNKTINSARNNSAVVTVTLADGNNTISTLPGDLSPAQYQFLLLGITINGTDVDQRFFYAVGHEGFGSAGFANLLSTIRNFDSSANYALNSITVDSSGNIILNATISSGTFTCHARLLPLTQGFNIRAI